MGNKCAMSNDDVLQRPKRETISADSGGGGGGAATGGASVLQIKSAKVFHDRYEAIAAAGKTSTFIPIRDRTSRAEYVCRRIQRKFCPCKDAPTVHEHLQNLNGLEHPHLCKLVEAFEDNDQWYMIYEKADAASPMTISRRLSQDGQAFTEEEAAEYTRQIAQTLAVSHESDIVHGRLSPSKILIAPVDFSDHRGGGDDEEDEEPPAQVKISDHGQGLILRETGLQQLMRAQAGKGTEPRREVLECMSPELGWDEADKENRSKYNKMDIWSLGCIVYHMLTGIHPHAASKSTDELLEQVKRGGVEFGSEWERLSADSRDITEKLLSINVALRPSAATVLRHPWLRLRRESLPKSRMMRLVKNIRLNVSEGHFKRMVLRVVSQQMSSESRELNTIERAYRFFDKDGNGNLGIDEILHGIKKMNAYDQAEITEIEEELKYLDRDGSGDVNLQEFTAGSLDPRRAFSTENLWHAFNAFDADKNGMVSVEEVEGIVRKVEAGLLGKEQVDGLVDQVRKEIQPLVDADGNFNFDQFVYIVSARTGEPHQGLAMRRDIYSKAHACLGVDLYKVRHIPPKPWEWAKASRSSSSAYRRASLVVPGRRASAIGMSFADFGGSSGEPHSPGSPGQETNKRASRGSQPTQAAKRRSSSVASQETME